MHSHNSSMRNRLALLLLGMTFAAAPAMAQTNTVPNGGLRFKENDLSHALKYRGRELTDESGRVQVFVRLDEPAVAELNIVSLGTTGTFAPAHAQREQAERVAAQQRRMRPLLESRGATILSSQRVGANGLRAWVDRRELYQLRALPGVRSVAPVEIHTLNNVDSVPWIGAPEVWQASGTGEGVRIAIIDSGIDYTHAAFGGSGNPGDYAANDPNVIEPGTFPTPKVVGGFDFAGAVYDARNPATNVPMPDPDPLDVDGHGTHVAGSAAGLEVPGSVGAGVAPGALLYALKVFGDTAGATALTSLAIEWAMDPNGDGVMDDHVDVINLSLGGAFGHPGDPSAISAANAAALGIVVVASAGNEGPVPYITGAPAVAPEAISVAANTPGGRMYARFQVTAPPALAGVYFSEEGAGEVTFQNAGPIAGELVTAAPLDGCTPLDNAAEITGRVALMIRGGCNFVVKYQTAQAAGARALVVYNDGTAPDRDAPIVMGGLDATVTIPGLMISHTLGVQLAATADAAVLIDTGFDPLRDDLVTSFSSLGPGHGGSGFKPDLAAPGFAIVSAGVGTGNGALFNQGTSMSAPHVAGAAALLLERRPTLDPAAVKALLQNSTVSAGTFGDTRLSRQGVGAVRVDRAVALSSYAKPGGISFGRLNPLTPLVRHEKFSVNDLAGKSRTYRVTHVPNRTYPGVEVTCPSTVRVNAKRRADAQIRLRFDPRPAWRAGVFDDAIVSQTEVDGWCVLEDGQDTLRVGYLAVVDPASGVLVLPDNVFSGARLHNIGPSLGWAEAFTLAKLGGEAQNGTPGSIAATGFRRGDRDLYLGLDVLELGIVTERAFEHLSRLEFRLEIDVDGNGTAEFVIIGTDLSDFVDTAPGQFATFQFSASGSGFVDWLVNSWDFNDRTLILPFTLASSGGFLPEKFDYVLTLTSSGEQDVQRGTVDLSKEIVPDVNSFGIEPGGNVEVSFTGPAGTSLWLLQNNVEVGQMALSIHVPRKSFPWWPFRLTKN
ncbi:MAG: S8 family serine peptidase [Pseudomonadota bacterium]